MNISDTAGLSRSRGRAIMQETTTSVDGVQITGPVTAEYAEILSPAALAFVAKLARTFEGRRQELLHQRIARQTEIDAGIVPDFLPETKLIRERDWTVAPVPA